MFPARVGRPRIVSGWFRRLLSAAAAAIVFALGAGGAQAAGGALGVGSHRAGNAALAPLGSKDQAGAVAAQKDGRIVVAGQSGSKGRYQDFAIARYTPGGKPELSFGTRGKVLTDFGSKSYTSSLVSVGTRMRAWAERVSLVRPYEPARRAETAPRHP